jgi:hypothetical protein
VRISCDNIKKEAPSLEVREGLMFTGSGDLWEFPFTIKICNRWLGMLKFLRNMEVALHHSDSRLKDDFLATEETARKTRSGDEVTLYEPIRSK